MQPSKMCTSDCSLNFALRDRTQPSGPDVGSIRLPGVRHGAWEPPDLVSSTIPEGLVHSPLLDAPIEPVVGYPPLPVPRQPRTRHTRSKLQPVDRVRCEPGRPLRSPPAAITGPEPGKAPVRDGPPEQAARQQKTARNHLATFYTTDTHRHGGRGRPVRKLRRLVGKESTQNSGGRMQP